MDTFTFIAKAIEFLAWPVASVVLVALLRSELRLLVPTIRRLKAGPVEAEFERKTAALEDTLPEQPKAAEAAKYEEAAIRAVITLGKNPRAEVLEAWLSLEAAAHEALDKKITKDHGPGSMMTRPTYRGLADTLRTAGLLHEGQVNLFRELQHLRNEVVHSLEFAPTQEAISRYVQTTNYLKWWLSETAK